MDFTRNAEPTIGNRTQNRILRNPSPQLVFRPVSSPAMTRLHFRLPCGRVKAVIRRHRILAAAIILHCGSLLQAAVYFVAPGGAASGDGTSDRPLDLITALSKHSPAAPGDTLVLLSGRYTGAFVSDLTGAESNPIIVRQASGARATIDGTLTVNGAWTTYWGFEVTNSSDDRTKERPTGLIIYGPHTRFINLVVHDSGNGFGFWTPAVDSEIYGCLIYHNGWQGPDPDRGHGHGIYTQNHTGQKRIVDNVIFNGFGWGIHAYTEGGALNGFHIEGNAVFNSGSSTRQGYHYDNILVGGLRPAERIEVIGNYTYHTFGQGGSNRLGYSAQNKDVVVKDNYFAGGSTVLQVRGWESLVLTGNTLVGLENLLSVTLPKGAAAEIDNNTSVQGDHPTGAKIFIRPNRYESGRANIIVYNWDRADSVAVDLREVLAVGERYEVHNVVDYFGVPVSAGTYSGGPITLSMTGTSTGPEFNVFVVESRPAR
jgi:Right handed beta helix region